MTVAVVHEFDVEPGDRSAINYDAPSGRLDFDADPPAGLILHTAGFDDDVFRTFDVWETEEHVRRFDEERMQPLLEEGPRDPTRAGPADRRYRYELHRFARP